eukprot:6464673-Amphidinium_carterae.1
MPVFGHGPASAESGLHAARRPQTRCSRCAEPGSQQPQVGGLLLLPSDHLSECCAKACMCARVFVFAEPQLGPNLEG